MFCERKRAPVSSNATLTPLATLRVSYRSAGTPQPNEAHTGFSSSAAHLQHLPFLSTSSHNVVDGQFETLETGGLRIDALLRVLEQSAGWRAGAISYLPRAAAGLR